jgi:oxygen-independent coproporphyrinogen-3 oxidase
VLDIRTFEQRHALDFGVYFVAELGRLRALACDGLVIIEPRRIVVTERGRFLLRIIAMCFDRYLAAFQPTAVRYSRAL